MRDSIQFTHDGKHYEIRFAFDRFRAFLDGRPANGLVDSGVA